MSHAESTTSFVAGPGVKAIREQAGSICLSATI